MKILRFVALVAVVVMLAALGCTPAGQETTPKEDTTVAGEQTTAGQETTTGGRLSPQSLKTAAETISAKTYSGVSWRRRPWTPGEVLNKGSWWMMSSKKLESAA